MKNDENWDGELSHLFVFGVSYVVFVSNARKNVTVHDNTPKWKAKQNIKIWIVL